MTAKPKRRMPVKTAEVDFAGTDYEGFHAQRRINAPIGLNRRYWDMGPETPLEEAAEILLELFPSWDFADEEGEDIPHTVDGFKSLPKELIDLLNVRGLAALKGAVMPDPLGEPSKEGPSGRRRASRSPETS